MSGQEGLTFSGTPRGSVETGFLGNSYFSPGSPSTSVATKKAVVLCTDGSGLALPNCKFIADELATRLGCDVWIPDYFLGRPVIPPNFLYLPERAGEKISWWMWIKFIFTVAIPNISSILNNLPSRVDPRLEAFIRQLKEQKEYQKIGAVGYWYGGAVCIRFAAQPDLLDTVVICHPGKFTIEDAKNMKVPNSWVCSEDDSFFPTALRDKCEAEFVSRKDKQNFVEYEFKVYEGTAHGFALRPNLGIPEVKMGFDGALEQTVTWFEKTLI